MNLLRPDFLLGYMAYLSYYSLVLNRAFKIRVWNKARECAKADNLFNLGVQYHTFALLRVVYMKPYLYVPIIKELKVNFYKEFYDIPRKMELDHLISLTIRS